LRPARALAGLLGALAAAHLALSAPALAVQPFLSSTGASLLAVWRGSLLDTKAPCEASVRRWGLCSLLRCDCTRRLRSTHGVAAHSAVQQSSVHKQACRQVAVTGRLQASARPSVGRRVVLTTRTGRRLPSRPVQARAQDAARAGAKGPLADRSL